MINIQNIDYNEYLKWCIGQIFISCKSSSKSKKKSIHIISIFGYENKEKHLIDVSKKCFEEKHVDILFIGEGEKNHYIFIKYFNSFMNNHTLHHGRKHFCRYC